jgi:TetR/AcrR family transcriptional regulator, cholesterol catabolism regulator
LGAVGRLYAGGIRLMTLSRIPRGVANEARWAEVLAAAYAVFLEFGYEKATVQEIAARAGMVKSSLYYYVDSKEDFLFALIKRAYDNIATRLESDDKLAQGDATARLCQFIENFVGNLRETLSATEARFIRQETHRLTPAHRHYIRERSEFVEGLLTSIVKQGLEDGDFDRETDSVVAVATILSTLNNAGWSLRDGERPWGEILRWLQLYVVRGLGGATDGPNFNPDRILDELAAQVDGFDDSGGLLRSQS